MIDIVDGVNDTNEVYAECFAGDVGSIGIAYILLFMIGCLILATGDVTYLIFLLVNGVDGVLTICHRIILHENLGEAHRKHAYQLMANELKMSHPVVAGLYMGLQLVVSLGFVWLCPVVAEACGGALGVSDSCAGGAGGGVCGVCEEILSFA